MEQEAKSTVDPSSPSGDYRSRKFLLTVLSLIFFSGLLLSNKINGDQFLYGYIWVLGLYFGGGTATFSPYKIQATFNIAAATANVGTTTLTTAIGDTDAVIGVSFRAFGLCTNAGSVILRSAQNAAGTGATILKGSWIRSFEVPV